MTIRPVGAGASVIIAGTATTSSAFRVQSNALRVVAKGKGCHIAIGTDPVATATNFYVAAGEPETIALTKASQVVVGVTKGSSTVITAPEGTQMPFGIGDRVTMTGANVNITGSNNYITANTTLTANLNITGANVHINPAGVANVYVKGNITTTRNTSLGKSSIS